MRTIALVMAAALCAAGNAQTWKDRQRASGRSVSAVDDATTRHFADAVADEQDFKAHLANILVPRVPGTQGNENVRNYIVQTLRNLDWDVDVSSHSQNTIIGEVPFHNVIATLDPNAPRRIVLACHYDSKKDPPGFLGATDSAVPCSQMLNLATTLDSTLKSTVGRNDVTLQLIFFDGEEAFGTWTSTDSIYGARQLADTWSRTPFSSEGVDDTFLGRIDVFVLLDLIGYKDPHFVSLKPQTQGLYDELRNIEARLSQTSLTQYNPANPIFTNNRIYNAGVEDDHIPFERKNVPILHLIVVPFPEVWHTPADNAEAVDYSSVANINKILRVFVAEYLQLKP